METEEEIIKRFNELMLTATEGEIEWAFCNELEIEEKIAVLQKLNTDRKLQIIENLKK